MESPAMYNPEVKVNDLSVAYGKLGADPMRPMQQAFNEHAEQLEKLGSLIVQLSERLRPVLNNIPRESGENSQRGGGSDMMVQITSHTEAVKKYQGQLSNLLEDLEV